MRKGGSYVLEIRDAIYRGREDFVYRIVAGELPFVTSLFPLGGRVGTVARIKVEGWNLKEKEKKLDLNGKRPGIRPIAVAPQERIFNRILFSVDTLPESREKEPNESPSQAFLINLPRIVNGRIGTPGDRDVFRFQARAGQEIVAEVTARRLGSPLDSLLVLTDPEGRILASNDDHEDPASGLTTDHADSFLRFKLPRDGSYFLRLTDTRKKGGREYAYRLRISRPRPGFALRVVPSEINVRAGTIVPITVYALRKDGFKGNISLALKNPPQGFALSGAWIPAGCDRIRLTLTVPSVPRKEPFRLQLVGKAKIRGKEIVRRAVPAEDMMQAFIYRHLVPARDWLVSVTGRKRKSPQVKLLSGKPVRIVPGRSTRLTFTVPKWLRNQLRFSLNNPPAGISIEKTATEKNEIVLVLKAEKSTAKPGLKGNLIIDAYMERMQKPKGGKGKSRKRRIPLGTLPAVPFRIAPPPVERVL